MECKFARGKNERISIKGETKTHGQEMEKGEGVFEGVECVYSFAKGLRAVTLRTGGDFVMSAYR